MASINVSTPDVPFDYIRRHAFAWKRFSDGYKVIFVENPQWGVRAAEIILRDSQVRAFNARLPDLLSAMSTQVDHYIPGGSVDCTLHHYENPLMLPDGRGGSRVVRCIYSVTPSDHNLFIGLSVETYDVFSINIDGEPVTLAGSGFKDTFLLRADELENIFPGWEARYSVAVGLGYAGQQLADIVCTAQRNTPAVDVTPVLFDEMY